MSLICRSHLCTHCGRGFLTRAARTAHEATCPDRPRIPRERAK